MNRIEELNIEIEEVRTVYERFKRTTDKLFTEMCQLISKQQELKDKNNK